MTSSALTPAARGTTKRSGGDGSARPSTARSAGHRTGLRRGTTPRTPRRVSGPAGGAATVARPAVAPRTAPPRKAPTRTAAPRPAPPRTRSRAAAKAPWRVRSSAYVRALPDHALLDRIIRGRAWIPLLGVLLVGIVAMQVEVLKLNAGIGRSLERASALQSQNEVLRAGVARLSDEQRIERIAAGMGMVMPSADQMRFVHNGPASVETALDSIKAPDATNFLAQLPAIGAPAAAQGTSTNTSIGTTGAAATGATATGATATGVATGATSVAGAATGPTSATSTAAQPTQSTAAASTPATTSAGATGSTTTPAAGVGTSAATSPVTSAAPPTTAGTTSQSSSSSTGGATPVGG